MRSTFIGLLVLLFAPLQNAYAKPNVVLFLVDDMGWMDSSVYGSQYYETPNMERLAKRSMRFTSAYAVPLCSPSRGSILTGQNSARHGITSASGHQQPRKTKSRYPEKTSPNKQLIYANSKNYLDLNLVTLAEVLKESGYRTGHFGKWHLGLYAEHRPDKHGFDVTWQCAPDPGPPSYFSPYGVHKDGKPTGKHHVGNITDGPDGEYITDRLTDEALNFIEASKEKPFFLNLWQYGVHGPWGHKEEYTKHFAKKKDPRGHQANPIMASMLKSVDDSLGRVMDKLDELNLTDNTLFIFFSDNGGNVHSNLPDSRQMKVKPGHPKYPNVVDWKKWAGPLPPTNNFPLREGKARIYEGGQRVPLMVCWPGKIEKETSNDSIVGAIDLYPTILDALKIKSPSGHVVDGESILPLLIRNGKFERNVYFNWFPHIVPATSVRKGDWKLIRRFEPHRDYPAIHELYNLKEDISESNNLAAKLPEKVKALDALIDQFILDTGALVPKKNPAYNPKQQTKNVKRSADFGLVPKRSKIELVTGALRVYADGNSPFLGTAQVRHAGPMTLKLKLKSKSGGKGKVHWKTAKQNGFPPNDQSVTFEFKGGDEWQDVTVTLPIKEKTSTIRLYLPANDGPVDVALIAYFSKQNTLIKSWNFAVQKKDR